MFSLKESFQLFHFTLLTLELDSQNNDRNSMYNNVAIAYRVEIIFNRTCIEPTFFFPFATNVLTIQTLSEE